MVFLFTEIKKAILKFVWNHERHRVAIAVLRTENIARGITPLLLNYTTKLQESKQRGAGTVIAHGSVEQATDSDEPRRSAGLSQLPSCAWLRLCVVRVPVPRVEMPSGSGRPPASSRSPHLCRPGLRF